MATIRIAYVTSTPASSLTKIETSTDAHAALNKVENLNASMNAGAGSVRPGSVQMEVDENSTYAAGAVSVVTVANASTVTVGGITFTGETGSPSGNTQWKCGVSATADALALATVINAHPVTSQYVKATILTNTHVVITAINGLLGVMGNGLILSSSDGTNLAITAMSSGVNDPTATTFTF